LDLLAEGLINRNTAIQFADDWQINEDDFYEGKFYRYIDKASRMFDRNYTSSDDVGANLSSEYYENTDKLSQIREVLVREYAIGAIIYKNDVESSTPNATSVCILDKSLIQDVV
jgi:hypothetical protein